MAYTFLASKRQHRENHRMLSVLLLALGEGEENAKAVNKQLEDWEKDS